MNNIFTQFELEKYKLNVSSFSDDFNKFLFDVRDLMNIHLETKNNSFIENLKINYPHKTIYDNICDEQSLLDVLTYCFDCDFLYNHRQDLKFSKSVFNLNYKNFSDERKQFIINLQKKVYEIIKKEINDYKEDLSFILMEETLTTNSIFDSFSDVQMFDFIDMNIVQDELNRHERFIRWLLEDYFINSKFKFLDDMNYEPLVEGLNKMKKLKFLYESTI